MKLAATVLVGILLGVSAYKLVQAPPVPPPPSPKQNPAPHPGAPAKPAPQLPPPVPAPPPAPDPTPPRPLPQPRKGKLSVYAEPWAEIYIDGRAYGQTPLADLSLSSGSHEVVLIYKKQRFTQTVKIKAGRIERLSHSWPKGEEPQ